MHLTFNAPVRVPPGCLAAVCCLTAFLAAAARPAVAASTNFDSLPEGFLPKTATIDGITFSDWVFGPGQPANVLSIEDGSAWWPDLYPALGAYVHGNILIAFGNSPGPNPGFTLINSVKMTTGRVENFASLNVVYEINLGIPSFQDYTGNTLGLRAIRDGVVVGDTSVTVDTVLATRAGFNSTYGAKTLTMSGVSFDTLELYGAGTKFGGGALGGIDNVTIVPEPATACVVALSSVVLPAALLRRRSRAAR